MIPIKRYLAEKLPNLYTTAEQQQELEQAFRDFADAHVREALEKAYRAAQIDLKTKEGESQCLSFVGSHGISGSVNKHSITNAYLKSRYIL